MIKEIVIRPIGDGEYRATVMLADQLRFARGVSGGQTGDGPWISADGKSLFGALRAVLQDLGTVVCGLAKGEP